MSRSWYAQTKSWASISKAKRDKRKSRRAAHTYAPRGRTSQLHEDVRAVNHRVEIEEAIEIAKLLGFPKAPT